MPFTRPTLQELVDRIQSDFETRIDGATSLLRRAVLTVMARVYAGAVHLLYGFLDFLATQLFVTTAESTKLNEFGSELNVERTAAVAATGTGEATGTTGVNIPAGSELQTSDGKKYTIDASVSIVGGVADVDFTASVAGEDGNDDPAIELTFTSPIVGVDSVVTVDADGISGGADEELDDAYRERILTRKRQPPHGGAEFDYEEWAKEVSGVTRAWALPLYNGAGTIGLIFVRDNDSGSIFPDASERQEVYDYIVEHTDPNTGELVGLPVTAEPGFQILEATPLTVDIDIDLEPNTATVQAAVEDELDDLILREGGPEETLYLSRISQAISLATGEERHRLNTPVADVTTTSTQIHQLGTVTFNNYI